MGPNWLFKYPRPNSGEHWAEKIAAEVAAVLDIPHAEVELAVCLSVRGSISKSLLSPTEWLLHGNECLSDLFLIQNLSDERLPFYDTKKISGQADHNLAMIFSAIEQYGWDRSDFAEYIVLDAIIGNTDRHHENWAWLRDENALEPPRLAPSFDHASSLGRELTEGRRERLLDHGQVGAYSERAPGAIYWFEEGRNGPAPLQLVRLAVDEYPDLFRTGLYKLSGLTEDHILDVVNRIPQGWMTELQRTFAVELMKYNLGQLRELIDG